VTEAIQSSPRLCGSNVTRAIGIGTPSPSVVRRYAVHSDSRGVSSASAQIRPRIETVEPGDAHAPMKGSCLAPVPCTLRTRRAVPPPAEATAASAIAKPATNETTTTNRSMRATFCLQGQRFPCEMDPSSHQETRPSRPRFPRVELEPPVGEDDPVAT